MKKILSIVPLALLVASCSTQRTSTTSVNSGSTGSVASAGINASATANSVSASGDATMTTSPGSMNAMGDDAVSYDPGTRYNPNNYMQNPEKYKTPNELVKTGGWTYNTEWNQNTNFVAEALGQWLLTPTEEVAAFWIPDSSRADSYAAYWAPEAVAAREQARMMALNAYNDSVAAATRLAKSTASRGKGKASRMKNTTNVASGSGSSGAMATGGISGSTGATASGNMAVGTSTTGASADMNSQGMNSPQTGANTHNYLMAVNGNVFHMPRLNLYLQNGTFTGYTGSNQLVGTLKVNGNQLRFDPTIPSTNISTNGGFSQSAFMERLARVDSYDITNGNLRLKQGNEVMFVLAKNSVQ